MYTKMYKNSYYTTLKANHSKDIDSLYSTFVYVLQKSIAIMVHWIQIYLFNSHTDCRTSRTVPNGKSTSYMDAGVIYLTNKSLAKDCARSKSASVWPNRDRDARYCFTESRKYTLCSSVISCFSSCTKQNKNSHPFNIIKTSITQCVAQALPSVYASIEKSCLFCNFSTKITCISLFLFFHSYQEHYTMCGTSSYPCLCIY